MKYSFNFSTILLIDWTVPLGVLFLVPLRYRFTVTMKFYKIKLYVQVAMNQWEHLANIFFDNQ